jgi:dienelactone hydrolase
LDGYIYRPTGAVAGSGKRYPAVVFLHGCGGLMVKGAIAAREGAWAAALNASGYIVLMVDSFTPRGVQQMCAPSHYEPAVFAARAFDAYAALLYLQMQPDVAADRIAIMGWSEGGGALLDTIRGSSNARPYYLPSGDFRAAVAFYPARCSIRQQGSWVSAIPLLVLNGLEDVWTPAVTCQELVATGAASHSEAQIMIYPNAVHDFDWPGMSVVRRLDYTTSSGVVPIQGEDPGARADALQRVPEFLARMMAH